MGRTAAPWEWVGVMFEHFYVYLCFGKSPSLLRELLYSLETLLPEISGDASRVLIYTDQPHRFIGRRERVVDIGDRLGSMMQTWGPPYRFRAKPMVLAEAIRTSGRACVLLDTDSFIRKGFDATVARALQDGAAMNAFVRRDSFPGFGPFETNLPHLGRYVFDRDKSLMLNSGLVAARAEHGVWLEDAALLIDALFRAGLRGNHDVEQFAIAEAFRTGGARVALIDQDFEHYCAKWAKRYMRRQLRARDREAASPRPLVPFNKSRVRLFKFRWNMRLALRALRRRWGPIPDFSRALGSAVNRDKHKP